MKAVILAAGLGSRLRPITNEVPKCMVPVNGIRIIDKQIDNLVKNGVKDIYVVSGYKAEVLDSHLHMRLHTHNFKDGLRMALANFPSKNLMLDAGQMNESSMSKFFEDWQRIRPVSLNGYVGGVHQLALFCMEHGIQLCRPQAVYTTSAPLMPSVRNDISRAFGAPVFDSYVSTEVHPIADQCACQSEAGKGALHIHADYFHLEFTDDKGIPVPLGEQGIACATDTNNFVFPVIRYQLGDKGRMSNGPCPCGRPYPLMESVVGRVSDSIYSETGKIMGECLSVIFDDCSMAVHNYQIHQYADKSVTFTVVRNKDYPDSEACVRRVAAGLQKQLGNLPMKLEFKDHIPHERGKIRYIISEVNE